MALKSLHGERDFAQSFAFLKKLWLTAPCNDCQFQEKCREEALACEPYRHWITTGHVGDEPKEPSGSVYDLEAHKKFSVAHWNEMIQITTRVDVLSTVFEESENYIRFRLNRRKSERENHVR